MGMEALLSCVDDVERRGGGMSVLVPLGVMDAAGASGGGKSSASSEIGCGRLCMGGGCGTAFCLAPMSGAPLSTLLCFAPKALTNVCSVGAAAAETEGDDVTDDDGDDEDPDPTPVLLSEDDNSFALLHCCCSLGVPSFVAAAWFPSCVSLSSS